MVITPVSVVSISEPVPSPNAMTIRPPPSVTRHCLFSADVPLDIHDTLSLTSTS